VPPNKEEKEVVVPALFQPITLRGITFKNRVVVSPMCMYSAKDGFVGDFHLAHLGSLAMGGAGLVFMEATGVSLDGRISPYCPTLHDDAQIPSIKRIADFVHANGSVMGIQLGHAGRKASTPAPFAGRAPSLINTPDSWIPLGPSPIPYADNWATPHEMTKEDIGKLIKDFVSATIRADKAGVNVIELHGAHGYLITNFLSPISNKRTDEYGGSFENRIRLLVEIVQAVRTVWNKPLFVRVSATEHVEGGWESKDTIELAKKLVELGVDVLDCSTGGNNPGARNNPFACYQVPYAEEAKKETGIKTMAVGMITTGKQAEEIVSQGKADFVAVGRQHLRDHAFTLTAARELNFDPTYIPQYAWSVGKFKM
jgi:2,4-dienoyl-CoA reductase-like NADH-dependent reductase (Old Yellow Enzyme family)